MSNDQSYKSKNVPSDYNSLNRLNDQVDKYIDNSKIFKELPTEAGLSLFLGFNSVKDLYKWIDGNQRFAPCISRARTILEVKGQQFLTQKENKNGNGAYRYMQSCFNYSEKIDLNSLNQTKVIRLPAKKHLGSAVDPTKGNKKPSKGKKKIGSAVKKKAGKK